MTSRDDDAVYDDIRDLAEDLHRLVATLAAYPPEIAAIVVNRALEEGPIRGKRKRRLRGFFFHEVKALRIAKAEKDNVPFPDGMAVVELDQAA